MKLPLIVNWRAEQDLLDAPTCYDEQRDGLGDLFLETVAATFRSIGNMPEVHGRVRGEVRRALVPRFPYGIYYRIDTRQVTVLAVYHASRDPRGWQSRA
jgi:plasmid stabilization system protein ParE